MGEQAELRSLLTEICENQKRALELQHEQITLVREQVERSKCQVEESIGLQREAVSRAKSVTRVAVPGILLCVLAIVYLVTRYF